MKIAKVLIDPKEFQKLQQWGIVDQYHKAKNFLLTGNIGAINFKKRQPYKAEIWYFRINKQYRAFCYFGEDAILKVFHIDNHNK